MKNDHPNFPTTNALPYSKVRRNSMINYSYPDPSYYDTTDVGVAFDKDVEQVEMDSNPDMTEIPGKSNQA